MIEENHSYAQMKQGMPFLAGLSDTYGYATHWTALAHPSLPNYLGIAGGTTFGILDDRSPAAHTTDIGSAPSVFDQAIAAGKTAGTYAETMPKLPRLRLPRPLGRDAEVRRPAQPLGLLLPGPPTAWPTTSA